MIKNKKVNIEDVACRAGVSITTVSRVINKVPTVSVKNVSKVEEAIGFLKFKPDVSAQRLARGFNSAIGLVIPGYPGIFHSFYGMELIRGVGHACETLKLDLIFHITNGMNPISSNSVGGIIFADIIENRKQIEAALDAHIPCVVINNIVQELKVNYIGIDNLAGGEIVGDYLASLGHQRIATVTGNLMTQAGAQRLQGFREALSKKKICLQEEYVFEGDYSRRSARIAAEKLLGLSQPPTAIFAASDDMALEVIAVILERGFKVPGDISVIGFDDTPSAIYGPIALTTIKQPLFQMADEAVRQLNAIMSGKRKSTFKKVLEPELVLRDSCSGPKPA